MWERSTRGVNNTSVVGHMACTRWASSGSRNASGLLQLMREVMRGTGNKEARLGGRQGGWEAARQAPAAHLDDLVQRVKVLVAEMGWL